MSGDLARTWDEELDSPDERVLSCGLRVTRLKAQLDRIEAKLGNRWAAFTDAELEAMYDQRVDTDEGRAFWDEWSAELEWRRS